MENINVTANAATETTTTSEKGFCLSVITSKWFIGAVATVAVGFGVYKVWPKGETASVEPPAQ